MNDQLVARSRDVTEPAQRRWGRGLVRGAALAVVVQSGLVACTAPVVVDDFQAFDQSSKALAVESDAALADVVIQWRRAFRDGDPTRVGEETTLIQPSELMLDVTNPLRPKYGGTSLEHTLLAATADVAADLNAAMRDYSAFLLELAGGNAGPQLEALGVEANANLLAAHDTLASMNLVEPSNETTERIALVSTLGAELAKAHVASVRKRLLKETIEGAQPAVEAYATQVHQLLMLIAAGESERYLARFDLLSQEFTDEDDLTKRRRLLMDLEAMNEDHMARVGLLRQLSDAFMTLPATHEALLGAVERNEDSVAMIRRLYEEARRIRKAAQQLAGTSTEESSS